MNKRNQGGWVASFVIVAVVLIAGLIGGVLYLRSHQTQMATGSKPSTTPNNSMTSPSNDDATTPMPEKTAPEKTENPSSTQPNTPEKQPSTSDQTKLPHTGPVEATAMRFFAVTAVGFSVVSYIRSRRAS